MYLVDTNIWLERLLAQAKSDEVKDLLDRIPSSELFITDFAFHSICVVLTRLKRETVLLKFVQDVFVDGANKILLYLDPDAIYFDSLKFKGQTRSTGDVLYYRVMKLHDSNDRRLRRRLAEHASGARR